MSKKNIFLLAAGYIAGGLVASLYWKKRSSDLRRDIAEAKEKGEWSFKILVNNFLATHENLIENIKWEIMTEENVKMFNDKKDELIKILNTYKTRANAILRDLKKKWESYLWEASKKLEALYKEKLAEIKALKDIAPEKLEELKLKLEDAFNEMKDEMDNLVKSTKR